MLLNGVETVTSASGRHVATLAVSDKTYVHTQISAIATWTVVHNLAKYPSVTVVDSGDSVVIGDVDYIDNNNLTIKFSAAFGGKAYLN